MTIDDGRMTYDFTGTSPQVGAVQLHGVGSLAAACFALRSVTDPRAIPNNGGCFRPLAFHLPEGILVNPREPAPAGCRTSTIKRITTAILGAFARPRRIVCRRTPAARSSSHFGGQRSDGRRYVRHSFWLPAAARAALDGVDVIETDATNCMNVPAEALKMEAPIRVHRVALSRDSGGPGRIAAGSAACSNTSCWMARRPDVSRRAASVRGRGSCRRHVRRSRQRSDQTCRRRRRGGEIEDCLHSAQGRPDRHRDRGWRWLRHTNGTRAGIGEGRSA